MSGMASDATSYPGSLPTPGASGKSLGTRLLVMYQYGSELEFSPILSELHGARVCFYVHQQKSPCLATNIQIIVMVNTFT